MVIYIFVQALPSSPNLAPATVEARPILFRDLRRGSFHKGAVSTKHIFAESDMANSTVATQTQLAIIFLLKPPPLKPPPTQVPIIDTM